MYTAISLIYLLGAAAFTIITFLVGRWFGRHGF